MENKLQTNRNVPTSLAHLRGVHDRAKVVSAQHGRSIAAFNLEVDKRKATNARILDSILDAKRKEEMTRLYAEEHREWLKQYRKETSQSRWKDARELNTLRDDATEAKAMLTNPVALATVFGFGTAERNAVATELNGLAPRALLNLATLAVHTGNKAMVGALVVANDKLPRADRPFSSQEIAAAVFGEEAEQAGKLIAEIDKLHAQSIAAVRETEGQPLTPVEKVSFGLRHGGTATSARPVVTVKPKSPVTKISEALAASHDFGG